MNKIAEILSKKPEIIINFPDWMLPTEVFNQLKNDPNLAIAEIAGRDSIAAILIATEQYSIKSILPTIAYTGTEYGSWKLPLEKVKILSEKLKHKKIRVFPPLFLGAPRFWWLLCGRYITYIFKKFGFYTPCLGCHLYLHTLRIPLAKMVGASFIITGERESHDGRIKLSQLDVALDAYKKFVERFGVNLIYPLRYIKNGKEIEKIIGEGWAEGEEQLKCVLSKNYYEIDGSVSYDQKAIKRFFAEFAFKVAEEMIIKYC